MTPKQEQLAALLKSGCVIPVLTIERLADAVPLARALVAGGVRVLEVTLRTLVALPAAKAIMADVPEAVVGIGTILNADDLARAEDIGAQFGISPGATPELLKAAAASPLAVRAGYRDGVRIDAGAGSRFWPGQILPGRAVRRYQGTSGFGGAVSRMCGFARPAGSARPMRRRGWPSRTWSRSAVPGCARRPISGPATGPA